MCRYDDVYSNLPAEDELFKIGRRWLYKIWQSRNVKKWKQKKTLQEKTNSARI